MPRAEPAISPAERTLLNWMFYGGFAVAIFAVALQMNGVHGGFVTNYLADIGGPIWMYGALRRRATLLRHIYRPIPSPLLAATLVFLAGTLWELGQKYDLGAVINQIVRGRYDPLDILAFAVSSYACCAIDIWVRRRV